MSDTVHIHVTNSVFDCDTCANTIERVLKKTAGVEKVQIDDEASQLEVGYDTAQIEDEAIREIVEEWGYTSSGVG
jgi:copper chaperone CopZ